MRYVTLWAGLSQGVSPSPKFGGHRHCSSGDIMTLVCHVILLDRVIKE